MFWEPDNYDEFIKQEQEWYQASKRWHEEYLLNTYPTLCNFLGLPTDFAEQDLEKAYKKTLIKYHPDKEDGDKEKFIKATEIYEELKYWYNYRKNKSLYNPFFFSLINN